MPTFRDGASQLRRPPTTSFWPRRVCKGLTCHPPVATNSGIMNGKHFVGFGKIMLAGLVLASSSFIGCAQPPLKEMVLYFPLGSSHQQQIKDFSGAHNNGQPSAIIVSNSPSLVSMQQTRQLTLALWIKPNSIAGPCNVILGKGGNNPGGAYGGYELYLNSIGDNDIIFVSGPYVLDTYGANGRWINNHLGEWIHVVFTINDQTKAAKFYVNGQPTNDEYDYGTYFNSESEINFDVTNNLYIGVPDPASNPNRSKFDGEIREVMVFNRALTESEIQKIYNSTNPSGAKKNFPAAL